MENSIAINLRSAGANAMHEVTPRPWPSNTRFKTKLEKEHAFDAQAFLNSAGLARKVMEYGSRKTVFSQGDPATSVLYIQKRAVKLTVVNEAGKEAVVALLGPGEFFGEGCLAGQPQRTSTAETVVPSTILVIEKPEMFQLLHSEQALSDVFIKHVLSRNIRAGEDLIDHLFNPSEKRLARTLLLLARYCNQDEPEKMVPEISQEMLAEMVGTTRSRVNVFMNKFRKHGFIAYENRIRGLQINESLLSVVVQG